MIFVIIVIICLFVYDVTLGILFLVGTVVVSYLAFAWEKKKKEDRAAEYHKLMRETDEILEKLRQDEKDEFMNIKQRLIEDYGEPNQTINLNDKGEYDTGKYIMVFAKARIVFLDWEEFSFDDIVSYRVIDNYQIQHGEVFGDAQSEADIADVVGCGAAGAMIGGETGAFIGASLAPRTLHFEYNQENDMILHDYVLVIVTNSFDEPTIKIEIGDDWQSAVETDALFARIMNQKQSNPKK